MNEIRRDDSIRVRHDLSVSCHQVRRDSRLQSGLPQKLCIHLRQKGVTTEVVRLHVWTHAVNNCGSELAAKSVIRWFSDWLVVSCHNPHSTSSIPGKNKHMLLLRCFTWFVKCHNAANIVELHYSTSRL